MKKKYHNNLFRRYFLLTFSLFVSAINFNLLLKPVNIVAGGTSGLSIVVEHIFQIEASTFIWIVYIIMFVFSFFILGKNSIPGILYASILFPLFVNLTGNINNFIVISYNDLFLIAIFSGILSGISGGLIYKNGFASSGLGIIGPIMNKCFKFSISTTNFIVNTIIVILGGYYFGLEMILYAIVLLYINSFVCNKIILGVSLNKAVFIRSDKLEKINDFVYNKLSISPTILKVQNNANRDDILSLVVVPNYKYNILKNKLKRFDSKIFFVTCNAYELKSIIGHKKGISQ